MIVQVEGSPRELLLTMDPMHIIWRVRLYGIIAEKVLQIGHFPISLVSLRPLAKRRGIDLLLLHSDMNPKDKQNHSSSMRLADLQVFASLLHSCGFMQALLHFGCI